MLGSILLDNEVLHDVVVFLRVEDFYRDAHQVIYAAIRDLYDKSKGIDAVTLAEELKLRGSIRAGRRRRHADRDRDERPARSQRQVLRRDRQGEGDQPPVDRERDRDHSRRLFQSIHGPRASRIGRAQDLRHRRGSDPGETLELKDVVKQAMDRIAVRADSGGMPSPGSRRD